MRTSQMQLRWYQEKSIEETVAHLRTGIKSVLIQLPTGAGKTVVAAEMVKRSYQKNASSMFLVHRRELADQTYNIYQKNDMHPSFILGGRSEHFNNPLQIASVSTLVKRLDKLQKPKVMIWDEAHHLAASQWAKIYNWNPEAIHILLSATPSRADGKPLKSFAQKMVSLVTTKMLIDEGSLSPYQYYAPSMIDTSQLKVSDGDYTKKSVAEASFASKIIGNNIEHYMRMANGKRNLVFACNVNHSMDIVERYNAAGIPAVHLDGNSTVGYRKEVLEKFAAGEIKVVSNVDLFGEGFDAPAVEVLSMLRPTMSTPLFLQQVGRVLRTCPEIGKTHGLILDHVNNFQRHGMPDADREWSLEEGLKKGKRDTENTIRIKRCPNCFFAHSPSLTCPNCGHSYQADGKDIVEVAGELTLIGSTEFKEARKREIIVAETLEELVGIEKARGYKNGWAEHQWEHKTGERLKDSFGGLQKIQKARGYSPEWAWKQGQLRGVV